MAGRHPSRSKHLLVTQLQLQAIAPGSLWLRHALLHSQQDADTSYKGPSTVK